MNRRVFVANFKLRDHGVSSISCQQIAQSSRTVLFFGKPAPDGANTNILAGMFEYEDWSRHGTRNGAKVEDGWSPFITFDQSYMRMTPCGSERQFLGKTDSFREKHLVLVPLRCFVAFQHLVRWLGIVSLSYLDKDAKAKHGRLLMVSAKHLTVKPEGLPKVWQSLCLWRTLLPPLWWATWGRLLILWWLSTKWFWFKSSLQSKKTWKHIYLTLGKHSCWGSVFRGSLVRY